MEIELFNMDAFIPAQVAGKQLDLEYHQTMDNVNQAVLLYESALAKMLRPYCWHEYAGWATASFSIDEKDNNIPTLVEVHDHLLIKIPPVMLPYWVVVEEIKKGVVKQADESLGLKLRACAEPHRHEKKVSHFFSGESTSTFILQRLDNVVTISYHGRNEQPNIHTGDVQDNIVNGLVAMGAMAGLSKLQWMALIEGLLSADK